MWRTSVCDGIGTANRGGWGRNLGRCRPCLPLRMVGDKYIWVDVLVCIGIGTNIDDYGDGRTDVLNSSLSGVAKETSRCNEKGSTYEIVGTESGSEEVGGCTDSGFE